MSGLRFSSLAIGGLCSGESVGGLMQKPQADGYCWRRQLALIFLPLKGSALTRSGGLF